MNQQNRSSLWCVDHGHNSPIVISCPSWKFVLLVNFFWYSGQIFSSHNLLNFKDPYFKVSCLCFRHASNTKVHVDLTFIFNRYMLSSCIHTSIQARHTNLPARHAGLFGCFSPTGIKLAFSVALLPLGGLVSSVGRTSDFGSEGLGFDSRRLSCEF